MLSMLCDAAGAEPAAADGTAWACPLIFWPWAGSPAALAIISAKQQVLKVHVSCPQTDRFTSMSTKILGRIDELGNRIDDLEKQIEDLVQHTSADEEQATQGRRPLQ